MESQTAYKLLLTDYPDVVNVEQMCEMLGGICVKTAYKLLQSGKSLPAASYPYEYSAPVGSVYRVSLPHGS